MRQSTNEKLKKFRDNRVNIIKDSYKSKEEVARLFFFLTYNRDVNLDHTIDLNDFLSYMNLTRTNGYTTIVEDADYYGQDITWDLILNKSRLSDRYIYGVISSYLFEHRDALNKVVEEVSTYISVSRVNGLNIDKEISNSAIEFIKFWKMDPVIEHVRAE